MSDPATSVATAIQASLAALAAASPDPADAVRVLAALAAYVPPTAPPAASALGAAVVAAEDATNDVVRRSAVIALAAASAAYQPASYDDAIALRQLVVGLLDGELSIAGDQNEDAAYVALSGLKSAVIQDLTARGADLAPMAPVVTALPAPSLVLAQRLYQDAGRTDELVQQAGPIHPGFMPIFFTALAGNGT